MNITTSIMLSSQSLTVVSILDIGVLIQWVAAIFIDTVIKLLLLLSCLAPIDGLVSPKQYYYYYY